MGTVTGQLVLDEHVALVVEFMERHIPAERLVNVADHLPSLAKVLWSSNRCVSIFRSLKCEQQSNASESVPVGPCVGDDSVAEEDEEKRK